MRRQVALLALWFAGTCAFAQAPKIVDLHFHWEGKASLDKLIEQAASEGVKLGVTGEGGATWGLRDDQSLSAFLAKLEGKPVIGASRSTRAIGRNSTPSRFSPNSTTSLPMP